MGVYSSMRMVGFAAGPLIGGLLQLHFGFNTAFYVGAALLLVAMILVQVWVNDVPVRAATEAPGPFRIIDRELLAGGIMGLGIATFLMASAFSMMGALENEFNARLQQTVLGFSIAFSALTFSRLLVQVPLGRLSDRVGRKPLILVGLILMAPATALLGEAGTIVQLTGLRVFQGIASGAIAAPAFALAADLARSGGEGRQMSILTMGFGLGIALGPLIAGVLAVVFFELPFLLGGLMSLIGVWVVYRYVPETVQRSGAPALAWAKVKVSGERDQKGQRD